VPVATREVRVDDVGARMKKMRAAMAMTDVRVNDVGARMPKMATPIAEDR
jgi:hypothetical protein